MGKPWGFRDDERLRDMFRDGCSDEMIAASLGRSVSAIKTRRWLQRLSLASRPDPKRTVEQGAESHEDPSKRGA